MKKMKLFKAVLLLFTVFTLTNCEENGEIQFIVVDDFETNASVTGLINASTIEINQSMDVSELLDNAAEFVEADVESVIITLQDYSDPSIEGSFNLAIGGSTLINQSLTLTSGVASAAIAIPSDASDILSSITAGSVQVNLSGSTTAPIADNDFTLNLVFKIKAKVQ